ncbi:cytochrome c biogenesis protein DipZ [Patulibacter defluvii]|uniref:cytochrome c biogenesis protein DipZ n=1 Tax=Patulibacter defluvii TaxID=3095358 RepID=UPI002A754DDA|nr:cytochrome c biogenesis protein DipZ [Patulibacter sp. DM4]
MLLLVLFAFVAGAATALSPCVLSVLPIVLAGGATGGRRRPLGIVTGLTAAFTFAVVALVYVISALGLPDGLLRALAIAVLIGFGVVLAVPAAAARVEAALSRIAGGPRRRQAGGFWSGTLLGAGLGLVYAPCAGPILAAVITTSAAQSFSAGRLAVALAYGLGTAVVLYLLMLGGRRLARPLARRSGRFQVTMGVVMVVLGIAMAADLDQRFQTAIAADLPSFLVTPTGRLEDGDALRGALRDLRQAKRPGDARAPIAEARPTADAGGGLPDLGRAPEFVGTQRWFNVPGGRPLTLAGLRGWVVLIDFWTYTCINCLRTLPALKALDARYRPAGLTIVGVHSPEFPFERSAANVQAAIRRTGIRYPVAQDNDLATWDAWGNQYWPASYLIDATGHVRWTHFGEGAEEEKERAVRQLLEAAGRRLPRPVGRFRVPRAASGVTTPETYLGSARIRTVEDATNPGVHEYGPLPAGLPADAMALGGRWRLEDDRATALVGARIGLRFRARRVYLVLSSERPGARVGVRLDGRPIAAADAGPDVHGGAVAVGPQRLYELVDRPSVADGRLELELPPGVSGYAFTFG